MKSIAVVAPLKFGFIVVVCQLTLPLFAWAEERPDVYTFEQHIRPIMENHCFECHGSEFQDGGLRLDIWDDMLAGGESGKPALVPGEVTESYLMERILMPDRHVDVMPPRREPRVSAENIVAIAHWIAQGAQWEAIEETEEAEAAAVDADAAPTPSEVEATERAEAQEAVVETIAEADVQEQPETSEADAPVLAGTENGIQFAQHIWPIIQDSCLECHSSQRPQGELRLDSMAGMLQGGERYGPAVIPGDPEESPLYAMVTLPEDHIDFMPASGDPLTDEERERIRQWIAAGAGFGDWDEPTHTADASLEGRRNVEQLYAELAEGVEAAAPEDIDRIRAMGAIVMPLNTSTPLLRVDFSLMEDPVDDRVLDALMPLAEQVAWLNLAGSRITASGLAHLKQFPRLTRLNLERSSVDDAALAHVSGCEKLYYLNLYGTEISDEGLQSLVALPELEQIYLWQTAVTESGAGLLREAYAEQIQINLGVELEAADAGTSDEEEAA